MPQLSLQLLGPCVVTVDGAPLAVDRAKALALLVYLALEPGPQPRDLLATLLWPGYDQSYARGNLRRTLSILHKATGEAWIASDRYGVSLLRHGGLRVDVDEFLHLLAAAVDAAAQNGTGQLQQAVSLYRDDFLAGFTLPDAPEWDEWQRVQTERLRERFLAALDRLAEQNEAASAWEAALDCARRRLSLDPTHEPAQRRLMRLLARSGDRAGALRQFEAARLLLAEEFDAPPSQESLLLAEEIRQGNFAPAPPALAPVPIQPSMKAHRERAAPAAGMLLPVTLLCAGVGAEENEEEMGNPEMLAARLEKLLLAAEAAVESAGGRLDPPQGNSLLAVFGADGVHEDDPERAVAAGLRIAEEMRAAGIGATVGIATGEAYVGPLNGTVPVVVTGAVVSRARRLQRGGGLGGLLVDRATWQRTRHSFLYDALALAVGDTPAHCPRRGLPRPRKSRGIDGMEARLIGRDGELKRLSDALAAAANQSGRFVALTGEAGIGKSRLVAALTTSHAAAGVLWLEGRCTEMGSAAALGPFVEMLESHFSRQTGDAAGAVQGELTALTAAGRLAEEEAAEIAAIFARLPAGGAQAGAGQMGAQQMQYRAMRAVCRFVAALCEEQPVALVLDDIHWADSLSLDLAGQLLETATSHRLFLLTVYRDDGVAALHRLEQSAQRLLGRRAEVLHLMPFSPEESRAFLASLLGTDSLPADLVEAVADKAQGNPFFTEEIVRELLESGALTPGERDWNGQKWPTLPAPSTVQSVILSRLHRLSPAEQEMLLWAAVIGPRFETRLLAEAASLPPTWEESLWRLEEAGFVYLLRSLPQTVYAFRHALGQEAIYASLSEKRRKAMHRQVGEAIERLYPERLGERVADLAYHFDRADADEKALGYLLQEGERSLAAYLNEDAARAFHRVLTRLEKDSLSVQAGKLSVARQRSAALMGMGKAQLAIGNYQDANAALGSALELGQALELPVRELVHLRWWLGETLFWLDDIDGLKTNAETGLHILGDALDSLEAALMYHHLGIAQLLTGDIAGLGASVARAAVILQQIPFDEDLRPAYALLGKYYSFVAKDVDEGERWYAALAQAGHKAADMNAVAEAEIWRSSSSLFKGDWRRGSDEIGRGLRTAQNISNRPLAELAARIEAQTYLASGDLDELAVFSASELKIAQVTNDSERAIRSQLLWAIVQLGMGSRSAAVAACAQLEDVVSKVVYLFRGECEARLGQMLMELGECDRAQTHFLQALSALQPESTRVCFVATQYCLPILPLVLANLQRLFPELEEFRSLCERLRVEVPRTEYANLVQWFLTAAKPDARLALSPGHADRLIGADWQWIDPFDDCSYELDDGLTIRAANCRDLWHINWSAPRYVRPIVGDCAAQTVCAAAHPERPAIGGLLLWQDEHNFLRLTRNAFGPGTVAFLGALAQKDVVIGLGHLPGDAIHLRLERQGGQVRALCSPDGVEWYSVGQADFPSGDAQVGLHAIGNIDRCAFPGAHAAGSAMRFWGFVTRPEH